VCTALCRVSLERPIHYSESVVDVAMRWAHWPGEFRHGNYLTVKPATVYSEIEQVVRINITFCPLHCRWFNWYGSQWLD